MNETPYQWLLESWLASTENKGSSYVTEQGISDGIRNDVHNWEPQVGFKLHQPNYWSTQVGDIFCRCREIWLK